MALTWGQVAYYVIVCHNNNIFLYNNFSSIIYFEPDQVFFVSLHLEKF